MTTTLETQVDAFACGFASQRSFTHPYLVERVGDFWRLFDAPRKREKDRRREEWIVVDADPADVVAAIARHAQGHHCISAIHTDDDGAEAAKTRYKELRYRFGRREAFMVHDLKKIPRRSSPLPLKRVLDEDLAEQLRNTAKARQLLSEHLRPDAPHRSYVALDGDEIVGWSNSVHTDQVAYCCGLYVRASHRRRGIASGLMTKMLRDDRSDGCQSATLMSSHTGALLYPTIGYTHVGSLLVYTAPRR